MNVWGDNILAGTTLYFILKMVPNIPNRFTLNPETGSLPMLVSAEHEFPEKSFQMLPYANKNGPPPKRLLRYHDNKGTLCEGRLIKVGRVEHRPTREANKRDLLAALHDVRAMASLPMLRVFIDTSSL